MISSELTILLPTLGRDEFTYRFLLYCNFVKFPFHIIIADGRPDSKWAEILKSNELFPFVSYDYLEYDDISLDSFYRKMSNACSFVKTKYVMQIDNDDIVIPSSVLKLIDKISGSDRYVAARGRISGIRINKCLPSGCVEWVRDFYGENYRVAAPVGSEKDRVLECFRSRVVSYYDIIKTDVCQKILDEIVEIGFTDLNHHEAYFTARLHSLGCELYDDDCLYYIRQVGTSSRSAEKVEWAVHLLLSNYTEEFKEIVRRFSAAWNVDQCEAGVEIANAYASTIRYLINGRYVYALNKRFADFIKSISINMVLFFLPRGAEFASRLVCAIAPLFVRQWYSRFIIFSRIGGRVSLDELEGIKFITSPANMSLLNPVNA